MNVDRNDTFHRGSDLDGIVAVIYNSQVAEDDRIGRRRSKSSQRETSHRLVHNNRKNELLVIHDRWALERNNGLGVALIFSLDEVLAQSSGIELDGRKSELSSIAQEQRVLGGGERLGLRCCQRIHAINVDGDIGRGFRDRKSENNIVPFSRGGSRDGDGILVGSVVDVNNKLAIGETNLIVHLSRRERLCQEDDGLLVGECSVPEGNGHSLVGDRSSKGDVLGIRALPRSGG